MTVPDGEAVIRVSDNGRGIRPEKLSKVFDLFTQGEQSLDRSEGGLGIGLTLMRSLVQLHNGSVEAFSEGPGRGSTFTVRIPVAPAMWVNSEPAAASGGAVKTVVVVEDQADARRMMQMLLETYGVTVYTAANGAEGASMIRRLKPELALVDLGLPIMSGFDLARQLRQQRDLTTRLVALSGYGQDADIQAALEAGFDEHLTKPPDPKQLERLLMETGAMSGRRASDGGSATATVSVPVALHQGADSDRR